MGDGFEPLDCDTDILMIGKDTFTVERLKELLVDKMRNKFDYKEKEERSKELFYHKSLFLHLSLPPISIIEGHLSFSLTDIVLIFPPEGREAQLLKLGSSGWKAGKMRVNTRILNSTIELELEFCYGEPLEPESPLDDIRQGEDYQKLVNSGS